MTPNVYAVIFGAVCALVAWVVTFPWRRKVRVSVDTYERGYRDGLYDAGEILRDIRVELGIGVGENPLLEEAFERLREARR